MALATLVDIGEDYKKQYDFFDPEKHVPNRLIQLEMEGSVG